MVASYLQIILFIIKIIHFLKICCYSFSSTCNGFVHLNPSHYYCWCKNLVKNIRTYQIKAIMDILNTSIPCINIRIQNRLKLWSFNLASLQYPSNCYFLKHVLFNFIKTTRLSRHDGIWVGKTSIGSLHLIRRNLYRHFRIRLGETSIDMFKSDWEKPLYAVCTWLGKTSIDSLHLIGRNLYRYFRIWLVETSTGSFNLIGWNFYRHVWISLGETYMWHYVFIWGHRYIKDRKCSAMGVLGNVLSCITDRNSR